MSTLEENINRRINELSKVFEITFDSEQCPVISDELRVKYNVTSYICDDSFYDMDAIQFTRNELIKLLSGL